MHQLYRWGAPARPAHTHRPPTRWGRLLAVLALLLSSTGAWAQLTGTKTIPGSYATLAAAITDLNAQGVGGGGVTFNIAAGYTETFASPTAGAITATGTSANPIVFQKSGTGANPLITAGVGTGTQDAIISLAGSDYVTFAGIDVAESSANTTTATQMEFGYALFRASATDGCQNVSISGATITLAKANTSTVGIMGANTTAASTTAVTASSAAGANSVIKLNGNTVSAFVGIYLNGNTSTAANADTNNEIGTTAGNTLTNLGGSNTNVYGIRAEYQAGLKIENNTITIPAGNTSTTVRGIGTGVGTNSGMVGTLLINNNTVNLTSATSSTVWGINQAGTSALTSVSITNNKVQNAALTSSGSVYYIQDASSASGLTSTITGNQILNNAAATTSTVAGIYRSGATGTATLGTNTVSGNTVAAAGGTFYGIQATTGTITLSGNTITNNIFTSSGTGAASVYGYYNLGSPTSETLTGNTISGLTINGASTATAHAMAGMYTNTTSSAVKVISGNTISGLTVGTASAGSGTVSGILQYLGTTVTISQNKFYDLTAYGTAGVANGLLVATGTTITAANNLIGNLSTPASTSLTAISGVQISGSTTVNLYYNTLYLNAASSGATFGTSGIYLNSTSTTLDARNNIVVNLSTAAGTGGYTAALRRVSGTAGTVPSNYATTSNNNLYYAGTPSATNVIYVEGTTSATNVQQTLAAYKAFMGNRDQVSVTENPPFANTTTGSAANFLHIATGTPTQVESGGTPISSVTTDFDGDTRNTTTPDIGADEGSFSPNDLNPPVITYTALGNTGSTGSRTLTVTITDASGLATGTGAPRLYYRVGTSGAYTSVTATGVSGSTYTFTIPGAATGSTVQYYVAAQDASSNGNVATSPAGGSGTNPPGSTAPATPNSYQILTTLSGTYYVTATVGSSPNPAKEFATLTAAAAAYNSNGLSGAVTFVLLDASYSTGETFPLVLNGNGDASATNTLTIKPGTGVSPTLAGSVTAGAVLKLNGADYVIVDGSNNGTTSQNLTISNTSATGSGNAVLWIAAASATDGANNNVVKNTNITGNSNTGFPQFTVFLGGGGAGVTAPTTSTPAPNSNNTLQNNIITKGYYGVFVFGVSATSLDQSNQFIGNQIGQSASATGFGLEGMRAIYQQNLLVQANEIQNVVDASGSSHYGLRLGTTVGAVVNRNSVHNVQSNSTTSGYVGYGIALSNTTNNTSANPSSNTLSNNLVYNISAPLATTSANPNVLGIANNGGYGDRLLFNTILLNVAQTAGTGYSAAISNGDSQNTTASSALDVRNNIVAITANVSTAAKYFGFYTSAANVTGSTLDYNDYYLGGSGSATFAVGNLNGTSLSSSATLAAWQTATGQEANSVSADPQFTQTSTVPFNLTPTAAALNNVATPIAGITTDYTGATRSATPDIGAIEFTPPSCQPPTALAISGITATGATLTFTAPASGSAATSYTVTYTPAGGTATTVTPNPTASPVTLSGLTASTAYTVTVTTNCGSITAPGATVSFTTSCAAPTYAALPITEGFENTWLSRCDVREVPSASWLNTPATGNASWRRDDDGAAANWTSASSGAYTPAGSQGSSHSARFHAYYAPSGAVGALDLYANLSAAGTKQLTFDYTNTSTAGSKLDVLLSTDGGATFSTTPLLSLTTATSFTAQSIDLTSTSATAVIRFRATSDFGSYDIGLDNVQVRLLPAVDLAATGLATPTATQGCYGSAETVSVVVSNVGSAAINFATNPATVTAVVTTPSGSQTLTGTVSTGTLAAGATQTVTLAPTLNMSATGTYSFAITATATGDGNTTNDLLTPSPTRTVAAPVAGTLSPASASICVSGTTTLTLSGSANGNIQFQSSTDGTTFTDISGATTSPYTTAVLTATTYFRAQVRCGNNVVTSNVSTITVNNPRITANNGPVTICSGSTATLTATASAGSQVRFFDVATGGTALNTNTPGSYITPPLTASTTYYAEAYAGGSSVAGLPDNSSTYGTFQQPTPTDYPLGFAVTQATTLTSVDVYPTAAGTLTIRLYSVSGSQPGGTTTAVAGSDVTITVTAAQVGTRVTVPLGYQLAAGEYKLSNPAGPLGRFSTYTGTYPLTSADGLLTVRGSYLFYYSTTYLGGAYNSFFNLTASSECVAATRTAIQVNVTPPATASFPNATATACSNSPYQLAGTVGGSATTGTYTSSGTGTFSPNATTLGATYTPSAADVTAGSVTITLTAPAAGSCPAATATLALTINRAPVATFSYPSGTYCAASTSTVTPALGTGATAGTFTASPAGLTINATTGVITLGSSAAGTYTVTNTVAASGACAAVTATATITVTPATSAAFSYGSGTYCVSGTTNPTPTITGTAGGTFSSGTGLAINATTGVITLSGSTTGTYTVTYTVAGACGSSSTQSVTITSAPLATFSYAAPAAGCAGSTGTVAPTLGTGASAGTFTASPAGLTINTTTGVITLSSSTAGTYTVTNSIAASGGCAAATATATYTVNAAPTTPAINVTGTPATGITLTSSVTAASYQWARGGSNIPGATGQSYTVLSGAGNGNYTVTVTNAAGCSATSAAVAVTVTPTLAGQGMQLSVHPNPTPNGLVTLELTGYRLATELTVFDALGRVVLSRQLPANSGTATHQLDLSSSASGVYVLRLRNADGVETRRLTRE